MLILGIDSSSAACSVAITNGTGVLCAARRKMTRGHAAALAPMISEVLNDQKLSARALDAVAVSTGPGSFTGLRIALAAAKGLALAADRPLIGISCFDAVARQARDAGASLEFDMLLLTLASKRQEVFVQALDPEGKEIIPGQALTPLEIEGRVAAVLHDGARILISGDAAEIVVPFFAGPNAQGRVRIEVGAADPTDAAAVASLAFERLSRGYCHENSYTTGLAPLYMRPPATTATS